MSFPHRQYGVVKEERRRTMLATRDLAVTAGEEGLLQRCRQGDLSALEEVYGAYGQPVYRLAYYMLSHKDDADDVKQETFLKAFRALPAFRSECSMRTWLLRICANLCRDRIKSYGRRMEVLCDPQEQAELLAGNQMLPSPAELYETTEMRQELMVALNALPGHHRAVLLLRENEDLSYRDMAAVLGCSLPSVKLKLYRARRQLKELVEFATDQKGSTL